MHFSGLWGCSSNAQSLRSDLLSSRTAEPCILPWTSLHLATSASIACILSRACPAWGREGEEEGGGEEEGRRRGERREEGG